MIRFITDYLIQWKNREHRKPLILRGARQVGKTYIVDEFGKNNFETFIKVNFEETPELKPFFETNDIERIIQDLEVFFGKRIDSPQTLLFLDEIQTCPKAIVTLRYFYEKRPDLYVIAAGSLLDHTLNELQYSMPVGRVEFAYLHPLCFFEFLFAIGESQLVEYLKKIQLTNKIATPIHNKLLEHLRLYFLIGGMPEAVKVYAATKSLIDVERVHESIIKSLEFDFSKYGTKTQQNILVRLLKHAPKTCGQKFKYVNFDNRLRSDAIKKALDLLNMSRIIHFVYSSKATGIPLENNVVEKTFKLFFLDIGLLSHILKVRITELPNFSASFEGKLAEQFVAQELLCASPEYLDPSIYYWMRDKKSSEAEIDFLTQTNGQMIPIEVKAGKTGSLKSLHVFMFEKKLQTALRFNANLPSVSQVATSLKIDKGVKDVKFKLCSLPLYLVREHERLVQSLE